MLSFFTNMKLGFPYEMSNQNKNDWGYSEWLYYWITQMIAFSYSIGRFILSKFFPIFSTTTGYSSTWASIIKGFFLIFVPSLLPFIFYVTLPFGFFTTLGAGLFRPLPGFPLILNILMAIFFIITLGLVFSIATITPFFQQIQLILTLLVIPLISPQGRKYISNTLANYWLLMTIISMSVITANASTYLDNNLWIPFAVTTICIAIYGIIQYL